MSNVYCCFVVSSIRRHTRYALVTGVQTWLFRSGEDARPARRRSGGARLHDAGEPPRARHRAAGSAADLPALCRGGSRHGEGGDVTAAASSSPSLLWDGALTPATHKARSEEHTSELQSLMRNSYAVFCLKN